MCVWQISNRRRRMFESSYSLLRGWHWDIMATLTFSSANRRLSSHYATRRVEKWVHRIAQKHNMHVGGIYVLCYHYGEIHVHILLIGREHSQGGERTLRDISLGAMNRSWFRLSKVEVPRSQRAVAKYLAAHHFSSKCHRATIDTVNPEFLAQHRLPPSLQ